jgi:N-sulfoglucosamine sulfohydrolase
MIVNLLHDRPNPVAEFCTSSTLASYVSKADVAAADEKVRHAYATWIDAPPVELYDLKEDPNEWRNLAGEPALLEVKARLLEQLHLWQEKTRDPLADPVKLAQLTAEHDSLPEPYKRPGTFSWRYVDYLAP